MTLKLLKSLLAVVALSYAPLLAVEGDLLGKAIEALEKAKAVDPKDSKAKEITVDDLKAAGLAGKNDLLKVLGNGEISVAVTVKADAFSKSAIAKIEAAGGKAVVNE